MSISVRAKVTNGFATNALQPTNSFPNTQLSKAVFHTSSEGYVVRVQRTNVIEYIESSVGYAAFALNDSTPLGQIICVTDTMQNRGCSVAC